MGRWGLPVGVPKPCCLCVLQEPSPREGDGLSHRSWAERAAPPSNPGPQLWPAPGPLSPLPAPSSRGGTEEIIQHHPASLSLLPIHLASLIHFRE